MYIGRAIERFFTAGTEGASVFKRIAKARFMAIHGVTRDTYKMQILSKDAYRTQKLRQMSVATVAKEAAKEKAAEIEAGAVCFKKQKFQLTGWNMNDIQKLRTPDTIVTEQLAYLPAELKELAVEMWRKPKLDASKEASKPTLDAGELEDGLDDFTKQLLRDFRSELPTQEVSEYEEPLRKLSDEMWGPKLDAEDSEDELDKLLNEFDKSGPLLLNRSVQDSDKGPCSADPRIFPLLNESKQKQE